MEKINDKKCLCRLWKELSGENKGKSYDNIQCSKKKTIGDFCKLHSDESKRYFGLITESRPEEPYKDGSRYYWIDQHKPANKRGRKKQNKIEINSKNNTEINTKNNIEINTKNNTNDCDILSDSPLNEILSGDPDEPSTLKMDYIEIEEGENDEEVSEEKGEENDEKISEEVNEENDKVIDEKNIKLIEKKIKNTDKFIQNIDQYLHNKGINKLKRLDIIKYVLNNINENLKYMDISSEILIEIKNIISDVIINRSEIIQRLFMFYGSKILKESLDQFYTPLTISEFINKLLLSGKKSIDPASGTGDLLIGVSGEISLWDISKESIDMAKMNYKLYDKNVNVKEINSLNYFKNDGEYDYCVMNPPFGTKTTTNNIDILNKYTLTNNKDKQELGILFIEKGLKLLKDNGILFIIVPGGYLGNSSNKFIRKYLIDNTRIISIMQLPSGTFSRSGTGVSTYLLIVKKQKMDTKNYNIHIKKVIDIGYELNKKQTPIKYKKNNNNQYVLDKDGKLLIINDLNNISYELNQFAYDNNINELNKKDESIKYYSININEIISDKNHVMEIGRYSEEYKNNIEFLKQKNYCNLYELCHNNIDYSFNIDKEQKYKYIDISEINTPLYKGKVIEGYLLPGRAKNKVKKNDILISRLRGNISFTVIMEDNLIVTNGVCILRPKNIDSLLIILSNIYDNHFKIQHQSLTTGSIMECITDEDMNNIIINKDINIEKYKKIYSSMKILQNEILQ